MSPFFSIIIPVYNVAPYLRECLGSVLAQSCTDWEAICVDDGSNDGSEKILDEYAARDVRIKVIHQKNAGVSAARNTGLECAKGDLIGFVDGDDCISPHTLQLAIAAFKCDQQVDAFRFGNVVFLCDARPEFGNEVEINIVHCTLELPADMLKASNLMTWRHIFRRKVVENVNFKPFVCGEDRLFTFECLLRVNKIAVSNAQLYGYRKARPESYTTTVIKTERGWRGEIDYRLAFLDAAERAEKIIDISGDNWLRRMLFKDYLIGCEDFTGAERKRLRAAWFSALPRLIDSSYFTFYQKTVFRICRFLPYHCVDYVLCFIIPYFVQGGSLIGAIKRKLPKKNLSRKEKKNV